jgi:hypothetical protein
MLFPAPAFPKKGGIPLEMKGSHMSDITGFPDLGRVWHPCPHLPMAPLIITEEKISLNAALIT